MSFETILKLFLIWESSFEDFINLEQYYASLVDWDISLAIWMKRIENTSKYK